MEYKRRHGDGWIVIGISGVTCGGKTTLANRLLETLAPVHVLHQDKYFYPDDSPHHVKCSTLAHNNYDILSALDMAAMLRDVTTILHSPPSSPSVAHAAHLSRDEGRFIIPGKSFLIFEGFSALNFNPLNQLCDLRYYFVLEYEECRSRRCYRLYDPPDVDGYFDMCVWPEHLHYRAEIEDDQRVVILEGNQKDAGAFHHVMRDIRTLL